MAIAEQRLKLSLIDELNDPFELYSADMTDPLVREKLTIFKKNNMANYGLQCFSKSFGNPVLWSHYGDCHRGVAMEFEICDDDVLTVSYEPNRLKNFKQRAENGGFSEDDLESLLTTKFNHWQYEEEVRTFCKLDTAIKESNLYFDKFSDSLKLVRVFLGAACTITDDEISNALPHGQWLSVVNTKMSFSSYAIETDQSKPARTIQSEEYFP